MSAACPSCGAAASGRFCSSCGRPLGESACPGCGKPVAAGARFCSHCGVAVSGSVAGARPTPRTPISRGALVVVALTFVIGIATIVWLLGTPAPQSTAAPAIGAAPIAPDISDLNPRERFQRLADRVQTALESGNEPEATRFLPMTEDAYAMLLPGDRDIDARFHIALLRAQSGNPAGARAEIDTILARVPDHLFGHYLTAVVADREARTADARAAREAFLAAYESQLASGLPEYDAHLPLLEQFRQQARTTP